MNELKFLRKKLGRPRRTIELTDSQLEAIKNCDILTNDEKDFIFKTNGIPDKAEVFKQYLNNLFINKKIGLTYMISPGRRAVIQNANKSRVWSNEDRLNMGRKLQGRSNPMQGKKHTQAVKEIISKNNLNRADNKGKMHYLFKGSEAKCPRGIAWYRNRKEYIKFREKEETFYCDLCKSEMYDEVKFIIIHHLIDVKKVIDIVQDINYDWNLYMCHRGCHSIIHNWLNGYTTSMTKEQKLEYKKKYDIAKEKMKELIRATQRG